MSLLGVIVIFHGVALLTPYASRLGNASGPLMVGYLLVMLLNQALVGVTGSMIWGMGGGMESRINGWISSGLGSTMTARMGWDLGMVAFVVLMLLSGVIMMNSHTIKNVSTQPVLSGSIWRS
jgi:hypothetical protein